MLEAERILILSRILFPKAMICTNLYYITWLEMHLHSDKYQRSDNNQSQKISFYLHAFIFNIGTLIFFSYTLPSDNKVDSSCSASPNEFHSEQEKGSLLLASDILSEEKTSQSSFTELPTYFRHVTVTQDSEPTQECDNSLRFSVECQDLESLECLWSDYRSGRLDGMAERFLLTDDIKERFDVEYVTLETSILEKDYLACKEHLLKNYRKLVTILAKGILVDLGQDVQRPIGVKPRLNFNSCSYIPLFKSPIRFGASNHQIAGKNVYSEFPFKTFRSEIRFHTNPDISELT